MSKRLTFSARAVEDLREIGRYTKQQWGIEQARRYRQELELALQRLSVNAQMGRPRDELAPGMRSFKTASHIAFYRTGDDGITIIRLLHPSMDIERAFDHGLERPKNRDHGHER